MSLTLPNANLYALLRQGFPAHVHTAALRVMDGPGAGLVYSWDDLERASARMANLLAGLGLPSGSRIAVQVEKSAEALMLYLAVLRAGHVFVPLNTAYQSLEMAYFLENAQAAVLVCAPARFGELSQIAFRLGVSTVYTLGEDRSGTLLQRAAACSDVHAVLPKDSADLAAILYTSGTTGRSKGAMLSHGNLSSNALVLDEYWAWRRPDAQGHGADVLLHVLPIFHVHGLFVAVHAALLAAAPMLWCNKFDPAQAVQLLAQASVFMGVPTHYVRMLGEPAWGPAQCANMRLFISGSAPLLRETFAQWQQRSGHTILERYGMSETIMLTSNPYLGSSGPRKAGTVGRPLPGVGLRIRRDDGELETPPANGNQTDPAAAKPSAVGGIEVCGANVFAGYWQMPEKTREEFTADGWFKTGDMGQWDADGYITIVGRNKDLIITGGYNVYPAEVEGYLNELDGVEESAVIGLPHADFGEAVSAVVVPKPGHSPDPAALIQALKQKIAAFKVPKTIYLTEALPRNAMGKVQKNLLRQTYAQQTPNKHG